MAPLIELRRVSKRYWLRKNRSGELKAAFLALLHESRREIRDELWALRGVSLKVGRGESLGIIGRNGSGKSTLLKLVAGIHRPTEGAVLVARGAQIGTLIELGIGFHPELSGRENVYLNAAIHGIRAAHIDAMYPAVVEYSGLRDFMDVQLKNYSSGMQMRLGFAVAANLDPDVLLLDEIFAVGDEEFQKQCRRTLEQFLDAGKTILFVSHSSPTVREVCRRVCLIEHGRLLYDGPVDGGLAAYQRLMETSPGGPGVAPAWPAPAPPTDEPETPTSAAESARVFDLLRASGLDPSDHVLEIGLSSLPSQELLTRFLEADHYVPFDINRTGTFPQALPPIDVAVAIGVIPVLPREAIGVYVASVVRALSPRGRFFATVTALEEPRLRAIVSAAGGTAERVDDWQGDPDELLLVITPARVGH